MRKMGYVLLAIMFLLVTFFGLGPIVFADGSMSERLSTLGVVLMLYLVIVYIWKKIAKEQ